MLAKRGTRIKLLVPKYVKERSFSHVTNNLNIKVIENPSSLKLRKMILVSNNEVHVETSEENIYSEDLDTLTYYESEFSKIWSS